ncbi:MAG TPA: LEA type 2 family protein [Candidatus Polarisedimenticolaceae bacterium]|nr:LEA type 2 family protein [Candidatus Polarisedimenticolaceae bacterium]
MILHPRRPLVLAIPLLLLAGCASLHREPLRVTVAGIEPMRGEGLEMRMALKLRVQNPNEAPVDYKGASVEMALQDETLATGVSDESGSIPGFGEAVIRVPLTMAGLHVAGQTLSSLVKSAGKVNYAVKGKLTAGGTRGTTFKTKGELDLPSMILPGK